MANLSDTFGTFTIHSPSIDHLVDFLILHNKFEEKAYYNTTFTEIDGYKDISDRNAILEHIEYHIDPETQVVTVDLGFSATGRWSFETNLRWFFNCITEPFIDPEYARLQDSIKNTPFKVEVSYFDSEAGCDFILEANAQLHYNPADEEPITIDVHVQDSGDYTASNLIKFGFYTKNEVWDTEYILKENDQNTLIEIVKRITEHNTTQFATYLLTKSSNTITDIRKAIELNASRDVYFDLHEFADELANDIDQNYLDEFQ